MYDLRPIEIGNTAIIEMSELLSLVFPETKKFSPLFLQWQYAENPVGKVVGYNAYLDGELAAHYATIPVLWKINGTIKKGLLSLNTATHPDHRGKKLFTQLAEKTYEMGAELGYDFVIGVANANSTPGFLRKLNFQLVSPLDAHISLSPNSESNTDYKYVSQWDSESLLWRLQNPSNPYLKFNDSVFSNTHIGPLKAIMLNEKNELGFLLGKSLSLFKLHIGLNKKPMGLTIKIPKKMQPSPLNLIYRSLSNNETPKAKDISFGLIDFDAY